MAFFKRPKKEDKDRTVQEAQQKPEDKKGVVAQTTVQEKQVEQKGATTDKGVEKEQEDKKDTKSKNKSSKDRTMTRVAIAGVVNAIVLIILVVVLSRLSEKALELKNLRNSIALAEKSVDINFADLEIKSNKDIAEKLLALYPNDVGLVDFVQEVEKLKNEGVVTNFSFANQVPVRDQTKYLGIPVALELTGSWEQIGSDLEKLQKLPYLLRPVSIQVSERGEDGLIQMKYGGFLYVDESLE